MKQNRKPGTYILVIALPHEAQIVVGALGSLRFKEGFYCYVGSALGGLKARLTRHLRQNKRLYWHIDYLLQYGQLKEIWYRIAQSRHECRWAQALARVSGISSYSARFGASDCACRTHLFYSESPPSLTAFRAQLPSDPPIEVFSPTSPKHSPLWEL